MKKLIALATAVVVGVGFIPATANAAPYLSMAAGKRQARKDVRAISEGDPFTLSCWRLSTSRIACDAVIESYDITCEATYSWRKSAYGNILFSRVIAEPTCY